VIFTWQGAQQWWRQPGIHRQSGGTASQPVGQLGEVGEAQAKTLRFLLATPLGSTILEPHLEKQKKSKKMG